MHFFTKEGGHMKKLIIILTLVMGSFFLSSCDIPLTEVNYLESVEQVSLEIKDLMPSKLNRNFTIEGYEDYMISYTFKNVTHDDTWVYHSPLYDRDEVMTVTVQRGSSKISFEHSFRWIAYESGHNQNKLYISLPVALGEVTKETYVDAFVKLETNYNGQMIIEHETPDAQLRGRGNSTWDSFDKKPYRLRFDKNTSILGMPEAKNYVLLAEYSDKSLMRNVLTHKMASFMTHIPHALETRYVEVYVNDDYRGVYVLTEHVEVHPNKFYIESIPGELNTNYFFEMDQRLPNSGIPEGFDWFNFRGVAYEIDEPDSRNPKYTSLHVEYLIDYMVQVESALLNKVGYEDLIDVENFIEHFIIHEFVKNVDVGWSSVFMYKEKDGPLRYAMVWDFDLAIGNADYIDYGPEGFYGMKEEKNYFFRLMMDIYEVRIRFQEKYADFYFDVVPEILEMIPVLSQSLFAMANRNFEKWDILKSQVWPNPYEMWQNQSYASQVVYVKNYLTLRSEWMLQAVYSEPYLSGHFQ